MHFWGPEGYAIGFYHLQARHRSQPREGLGHYEDEPDLEHKWGTTSYRVSHQLVTYFITPFGSFCYVMMPFGLKNAGATYQQCMLKCFGDLIGRTIEAYVDDIMVKSKWAD